MSSPSGCPRCAMHHARYVKAHRQLQAAGVKIIELEERVRELERDADRATAKLEVLRETY